MKGTFEDMWNRGREHPVSVTHIPRGFGKSQMAARHAIIHVLLNPGSCIRVVSSGGIKDERIKEAVLKIFITFPFGQMGKFLEMMGR